MSFYWTTKKINNPVMDWDKTKTIGAEKKPKNYG